jgi:predicted phosphodiesterase
MSVLVISDLHLTSQPRDAYRWEVMEFIRDEANRREDVQEVWCLGDITDAKDRHPSDLVNRMVSWILSFEKPIRILKGNHDYIHGERPFFGFMDEFEGIDYITEPTRYETVLGTTLWLPHTRTAVDDWAEVDLSGVDIILTHQSYEGALAANGVRLESKLTPRYFTKRGFEGLVLSGDIHRPQILGDVIYIGTQYPVVFGDTYDPRYIELHQTHTLEVRDIPVKAPRKMRVSMLSMDDLPELNPGDMVKITYGLNRANVGEWDDLSSRIRVEVEKQGAILYEVTCHLLDVNHTEGTAHAHDTSMVDTREIIRSFVRTRGLSGEDEQYALGFADE